MRKRFLTYLCCVALILGDGNAARAMSPMLFPLDPLAVLAEQLQAALTLIFSSPTSRSSQGHNTYQSVELEKQARFLVTDSTPSGTLSVDAHRNMHLVATEIRHEGTGDARFWAAGNISAPSLEITSQSKTYGEDGFTEIQETRKSHLPTRIRSQGPIRFHSQGESTFQGTQFQGPNVGLAAGGRMHMLADRSSHKQQRHWDRRGLWFKEGKNYEHYVEQIQLPRIFAPGPITIHGVGGTAIDQEQRLAVKEDDYEFYTYHLDPGIARGVSGQPNVYYRPVQARNYEWIEKQTQLTPVGAAVVALAAMVLTNGVGASLAKSLGFVSNTVPFAMVEAGVQAAIASASIQVVQGQGDLDRTLKGLASPETLKSIVAAMLTAGMTRGFLSAMKVPVVARVDPLITSGSAGSAGGVGLGGVVQSASMTGVDWSHRLVAHGVMATTSTFVRGVLSGGDPEVIKAAALQAIGTAIATEGSLFLGQEYHSGDMPWLPHKVGHGVVGCAAGAVMDADDPAKGCLAGGFGAVAGEIIGEGYLNSHVPALIQGDVSEPDLIQQTGNVARLAGGFVAGAAGGDVNVGAQTGGAAAENNAVFLVPMLIAVGYAAIEGGGDPRAGLEKIHDGEDTISKTWKALKSSSVGRMIASGKAELTQATYEAFPDAMARLEKMKAVFGEGVQAALTYLDTRTGHVVTRFWDSLDPSTKKQILGGAELFSWVAGVGVVAGSGKVLTTTVMSKEVSGLGRRALLLKPDASEIPIAQGQAIVSTSKGVHILPETLARQGTSPNVGDFKGLKGASVDEIISRVPKTWIFAPQKKGEGIRFFDEKGKSRIRIHGPDSGFFPGSNAESGWVLRVMNGSGSYYDDLGHIVPHDANAGHIPIKGNPKLP